MAAGLAAGGAAAVAVAGARWSRGTAARVERLAPGASVGARGPFALEALEGLPAPVQRYFRFALTPGQPRVRTLRVAQHGELALRPGAWHPFDAEQHLAAEPPGFVWDATLRLAPLVAVRVRDSYLEGEGRMHGAVAGLVTLVDQHGTPELAAASLQRFLAEAVWLPTALLPRPGLRWSALDDRRARVTLRDRDTEVAMDFDFGPRGEIIGLFARRYRDEGGTPVLTPWIGHLGRYTRVHGMQVPTEVDVGWELRGEWRCDLRARLGPFHFDDAPAPVTGAGPS